MSSSDDSDSDDEPLVRVARGSNAKSCGRKPVNDSSDDSEVEKNNIFESSSSSDDTPALKLKEKSKHSAKSHRSRKQSRKKTTTQGNNESGDSDGNPTREAKTVDYESDDTSDHQDDDSLSGTSSSDELKAASRAVKQKKSSAVDEDRQPKNNSKASSAEKSGSEDTNEDGILYLDKAPNSPSSTSDSGVDDPLPVKKEEKEKKESKKGPGKKAKTKTSQESEESNKILSLKKYIRACGIHIQNYAKLFDGCKAKAAKERKLIDVLSDAGIQGRPTLEKCRLVRLKREEAQEIAELDLGNIITTPCHSKYFFANFSNIHVMVNNNDLCIGIDPIASTYLRACQLISMDKWQFIHGACQTSNTSATAGPGSTMTPSTQASGNAESTTTPQLSNSGPEIQDLTDPQMISQITHRNRKVISGIYRQFQGISLAQCMEECLQSHPCQSANYKWTHPEVCELSTSKAQDSLDLTEVDDYIYYTKLE